MLGCFSVSRDSIPLLAHGYNFKLDLVTKYFTPAIGRDSCFTVVTASRPFSSGFVKLSGKSPYDRPIIDPNYFGDEANIDFKVLVEGIKRSVNLMENTSYGKRLGVNFTDTKLPGCEHLEHRTDPYWECFVRGFTISVYHQSGTAAMGSVVDSRLKVIGTKNLRVMDSSIAPAHISTNTGACAMMIGEKGAHMVLQELAEAQQLPSSGQLQEPKSEPVLIVKDGKKPEPEVELSLPGLESVVRQTAPANNSFYYFPIYEQQNNEIEDPPPQKKRRRKGRRRRNNLTSVKINIVDILNQRRKHPSPYPQFIRL